jgi:hypothetical protein
MTDSDQEGNILSHWKRFSSKLNAIEIQLGFFKNSIFHSLRYLLQFSERETHIHNISNTYVSFPQLFS